MAPAGPRNIGIDMAKGHGGIPRFGRYLVTKKIERQLDVMKDTEACSRALQCSILEPR